MCERCQPFGGLWKEAAEGLTRCDCARGQNIRANEARRQNPARRNPAMTKEEATIFAEMLAVIPFYPPEAGARIMVAEEIRSMCANAEEAKWLVQRPSRALSRGQRASARIWAYPPMVVSCCSLTRREIMT
jgi:hypothetical protein